MNDPRINLAELVEQQTRDNMEIYQAGHREGYRLGFADGIAAAKKVIEKTLGPICEEVMPNDAKHSDAGPLESANARPGAASGDNTLSADATESLPTEKT